MRGSRPRRGARHRVLSNLQEACKPRRDVLYHPTSPVTMQWSLLLSQRSGKERARSTLLTAPISPLQQSSNACIPLLRLTVIENFIATDTHSGSNVSASPKPASACLGLLPSCSPPVQDLPRRTHSVKDRRVETSQQPPCSILIDDLTRCHTKGFPVPVRNFI